VRRIWRKKNTKAKLKSFVVNLALILTQFLLRPKVTIIFELDLPKKQKNKIFMKKLFLIILVHFLLFLIFKNYPTAEKMLFILTAGTFAKEVNMMEGHLLNQLISLETSKMKKERLSNFMLFINT
jgi:predicted transglutaminase-like protease